MTAFTPACWIIRAWPAFFDDREDALATAAIRATLKVLGTPIGPYDLILAGCALRRGLMFVTDNVDEFKRVEGLTTENWISRN